MCASYGLGGGPYTERDLSFEPFSDPANLARLNEWARERKGSARITGRKAINLNPVVRNGVLELAWWSIPRPSTGTAFNSRDDSLMRYWKPQFQHRALLPATWYIEKSKRFGLDGQPFMIAAILDTIISDDTEYLAYSMVTRSAIGEASTAHDRMPLALPENLHAEWLDPDRAGDAQLVKTVQAGSRDISEAMTVQ